MKNIFTFLFAVLFAAAAFSQTYLSEDFSSATWPPTGWTYLPVGEAWSSSNTGNAGGIAPEAKFKTQPFTGSARLASPLINLSGVDTVMLLFKHYYADAVGSGPAIGVATRAGGAWTSVWETTPTANQGPEEVSVLITNNTGASNFQISFYLTGNLNYITAWYLDDIELFSISGLDAKMTAVLTPAQIMNPAPVEGRITNLGTETITELSVSWKSYAGIVRDSTFSGLALEHMDAFDFAFEGSWASPYGTHNLDMWINSVNGGSDENQGNDTISKPIEYISMTFQHRPTLEEFTSSTCGPCASFNSGFVPWCENNADDITLIKYQMNWPGAGDPYYTPEGGTRRNYYGVSYVPDLYFNGAQCATSVGAVQAAFDAAMQTNIPLTVASSFEMTGSVINITTNILPFQTFGSVKVYNVIFEKITTQNVATNGETEFHHVMMKMMPDANGTSQTLQEGVPISLSYTYDMSQTNVEELDDLMVGVIIQNPANKQILQSGYGYDGIVYSDESRLDMIYLDGVPLEDFDPDTYSYDVLVPQGTIEEPVITVDPMDDGAMPIVSMAFTIPGTAVIEVIAEDLISRSTYEVNYDFFTGIGDEDPMETVNVFPNPANDNIYVTGLDNARVSIHSTDGKLMILKENFSGNNISIDQLTRGIYIMNIQMENKQFVTKKLVVL